MKIVLINTSERSGGAAIACNRLMNALNKEGIDVKTLVLDKATEDSNIVSVNTSSLKKGINFFRFIWERFIIFVNNKFKRDGIFEVSLANVGVHSWHNKIIKDADIIHLHWVNHGMLSLKGIKKLLSLGKPIVWTMHDMWPMLGIDHYLGRRTSYQPEKYSLYLSGREESGISLRVFNKKKEIYKKGNINFVACSKWLYLMAKESYLLSDQQVISIPNPIDTDIYKPINKIEARTSLNLPLDKKILLFGSCKITDKRKGIDYLIEACNILNKEYPSLKEEIGIIILGKEADFFREQIPFTVYPINYTNNTKDIINIYNSSDLYAIPSLEDNLPNMIMESMACGVPCVGFNIGGIPEMIDHEENGYIAQYKSANDFANGIYWLLANKDKESLSKNAILKVTKTYNEEKVANEYINLYKKLY